jgi:hypothetical protein
MITAEQFNWMYQDYKRDDEFVYAIDYAKIDGRTYITGITKSVGSMVDYMNDDYWAEQVAYVGNDCEWTTHSSTFGAICDLMTTRARKTKRERKSFDATTAFLEKLPLDEKVEL